MNKIVKTNKSKSLKQKSIRSISNKLQSVSLKHKIPANIYEEVVFLLDVSASMGEEMTGGMKLDILKKAMIEVLTLYSKSSKFEVMSFSHSTNTLLKNMRSENDLKEVINNIQTIGATYMGIAIKSAHDSLKRGSDKLKKRIVLVTDGEPNGDSPNMILEYVGNQIVRDKITIDCVGIGEKGGYSYDPDFLSKIAIMTGGMFLEVNDISKLGEQLISISSDKKLLSNDNIKQTGCIIL